MLTNLLHRSVGSSADSTVSRDRAKLARGLERIADAAKAEPVRARGLAPIIRPQVAAACTPAAFALAATLRDPDVEIAPEILADVRRFLTDGCSSPLYARSPETAFRTLAELASIAAPARRAARVAVSV